MLKIFCIFHRVEDMLRWVTGVNNVASVHPVQERPLDLLPEGKNDKRQFTYCQHNILQAVKIAS